MVRAANVRQLDREWQTAAIVPVIVNSLDWAGRAARKMQSFHRVWVRDLRPGNTSVDR